MPVKRVEALQLGELLGSLMSSVVDAQAQAARATVDFIEQVGFVHDLEDRKELRYVAVRYKKLDEDGNPASFEVEIPLLAMVNVPLLAVKEAKFALAFDVVTASNGKTSEPVNSPTSSPARLKGFIRKKTPIERSSRQATSVDVDVVLEQQNVPVGIERLFDLAELGISERIQPENGDDG